MIALYDKNLSISIDICIWLQFSPTMGAYNCSIKYKNVRIVGFKEILNLFPFRAQSKAIYSSI